MIQQLIKRLSFYSVLLIFFGSITSCIEYKEVEVIKVTDVGIENFSAKGVNIRVGMQINNPNNYKISVVDSDLNLFVKGNKVGTATIENKVTLPRKSNEIHYFTIKTAVDNMGANAIPMFMSVIGRNSIDLQVIGDIKARAKGISKKFPVDFKENVKLQ